MTGNISDKMMDKMKIIQMKLKETKMMTKQLHPNQNANLNLPKFGICRCQLFWNETFQRNYQYPGKP